MSNNATIGAPEEKAGSDVGIEQELLTAEQVAKILGVHRATVFKLNSMGKMPRHIKLGRATRWNRAEIRSWMNAGCPVRAKWEDMRSGSQNKKRLP